MTLPNIPTRDEVRRWLFTAPLPVVLSICLTTSGSLAGWVWLMAGEVADQKAVVAVAVEQAHAARLAQYAVEIRLVRVEEKLDRLIEAVADLRIVSTQSPRPRSVDKEKNR